MNADQQEILGTRCCSLSAVGVVGDNVEGVGWAGWWGRWREGDCSVTVLMVHGSPRLKDCRKKMSGSFEHGGPTFGPGRPVTCSSSPIWAMPLRQHSAGNGPTLGDNTQVRVKATGMLLG